MGAEMKIVCFCKYDGDIVVLYYGCENEMEKNWPIEQVWRRYCGPVLWVWIRKGGHLTKYDEDWDPVLWVWERNKLKEWAILPSMTDIVSLYYGCVNKIVRGSNSSKYDEDCGAVLWVCKKENERKNGASAQVWQRFRPCIMGVEIEIEANGRSERSRKYDS